jgi:glycosyltransferase involved in cell wall biosynthesis
MPQAPKISVVIPCFNHGEYLDEAVDSVLAQTFQDFEIIIVDDGSDDPFTKGKLSSYEKPCTKMVRSENQGLAAARNLGISHATGIYIFPLDADDRMDPTFLEKAAAVLDERPEVGMVYSEVEWFGTKTGKWDLPPYRFPDILLGNVIIASALFRRADWELVGGYSAEFQARWEDYDFWLSLIEHGRVPYRIPEVLFHYRQRADSMTETGRSTRGAALYEVLFRRHRDLYVNNIGFLFSRIAALEEERVLRGSEGLQLQVFVPVNGEYSEKNSLRQTLRAGVWEKIEIDLPSQWDGRLRIDPANAAGDIEIEDLRLLDGERVVWPEPPTDVAKITGTAIPAGDSGLRLLAWGDDPRILLTSFASTQPLRLSFRVRVSPYSSETASAASVWFRLWQQTQAENFETAESPVILQVFLPEGRRYSEQRSVRTPVLRDVWQTVRVELPLDWRGALRLDPVNVRCCVEIDWVRLEDQGRKIWEIGQGAKDVLVEGTAVAVDQKQPLSIVAWGGDPQLYLPTAGVSTNGRPSTLVLKMRVTPCGNQLGMQAELLASMRQRGWRGIARWLRLISRR